MIKSFLTQFLFFVSLLFISYQIKAQQVVFNEDFSTAQGSSYIQAGPIGSSIWTVARSGQDFGARINGGMLTLTNDATSASNRSGWVSATTSTSNFDDTYNPILNQNAGIVSWTFNMRQIRSNPRGFESGQYGVAFILAGTPGSNISTGKGWAIQLGNFLTTDPIRLVTYSNGLKNFSTKLSSKTSGYTDFGREYTSVRVEYNPADNKWSLYLRKDGGAFQNPKVGTLVHQETKVYTDFINEPLIIMGGYWSAATSKDQTAFFDNISVSVQTPEIISIDPDSKIAGSASFTMTVNGKGFLPNSKVQWNGQDRPTTYVSSTKLTAAIPASDLALSGTANVQVKNNAGLSNTIIFDIEPSGAPTLTLSKNLLPTFNTTQGTASTTETYTIKGDNLEGGATLTAPSPFEMSVGTSTTYSNPLTLPNTGGGLTGQPLTINVRVKATASAGVYAGNITNSAAGAVTKLVAVSVKVLALEPTIPATAVNFSNITSTSMTVNWANGNGWERIVLIREAAAVNALPVDGTNYTANATFGVGNEIGTSNFVIYKGNGSSVTVNGLNPATTYHVSVIEFIGPANAENYRTSGTTGNQLTLNSPAGLQVKVANTSYKIDFDSTVDGVNLGEFLGAGIAKVAEPGQLDSDSWAFTDFEGGAVNFGGNSPEDSSYENGASDGDVDETGIYAFNVSETAENYTLGIKPGGADFNPGNITLRLHNRTSSAITSLNIGYKVYVKNVENSSTKVSFSHKLESATNFSGDVTAIDVVSEATADLNPSWKASYRVVTLSGLNIPADKYYNLRWSGSTTTATAAQDEFGIDDIEVIANPSSNNVSFDGIANDFVLAGNANLSADLSVQNRLVFNGGKLAIKDKQLTIAGDVVNTITGGLIGGATSKLVVRGTKNPTLSFDQTTLGTTNALQSFSLIGANANTVSLANSLVVNQLLAVDELQVLDLGQNTLTGTLNSILNNGLIKTQNTTPTPFAPGRTWNGTGILHLNGAAAQTLVAGTYNNLKLSSTGGTNASANVTVNGTLDLPAPNASTTKGSLDMKTFTLTMGPDATNIGVGDVSGIITRNKFLPNITYTFGHPDSSISFQNVGTLPSTMSAKLTIGTAPTWRTGAIKRQFDIIQTGASGTKAIIRQHYLDGELNDNAESKLVFWANKIGATVPVFEQGRSNNNMTENWVEISNANVAQYFVSTFDQVYITLDESEAAVLTWNGSASTSWITAENWTKSTGGTGVPSYETKVTVPNILSSNNRSPIIDNNSSVKSITIEEGGIVDAPDNSLLSVFDGAGAWQNNGTFNPGAGTSNVTFNNADATISGATAFNNITIATGASLRALDGNSISVTGTFTNNGLMSFAVLPNAIEFTGQSQIIPLTGGSAQNGFYTLKISGSGTTIATNNLNIRGDLMVNEPVVFTDKTVNFTGLAEQTIGGTAAINLNNLIINKSSEKVSLAKDININGTLTLTSGSISLGANNLTIGNNPIAGTFNVQNMIITDGSGQVRRPFTSTGSYFFPIGELTSSASYSPIKVNITAGTFSNAFVGVNVIDAIHPNNNSQNFISRYWNVKQVGITGAVATITADYVEAENLFPQESMAAGQLDGDFNLATNPWKKVGTLTGKTLTTNNVSLTNDQTSVFTGIKGGDFSVEVYGYGEFCQGSEAVLTAQFVGGDAPYTYIWSHGLPNSQNVSVPTDTVGSITYTLTVRDANGFIAEDNNSPVTILPATVAGSIQDQDICASSVPNDLVLSESVGNVLYWQRSKTEDFAEFTNISNFTTLLSGTQIGPINQTTYFRAVLQNGDCAEVFSTVGTVTVKSTTWNGTAWSNGEPNASTTAIFQADYNYTDVSDLIVCSMVVEKGATVTISAEKSITIQNNIINNGNIIVESDGNLIQVNDSGTYTGDPAAFKVQRTAKIKRLDYVYWSSPVAGQKLKAFSPGTLDNRFLTYSEAPNLFVTLPDVNVNFEPGKGYAIRASNRQSSAAVNWTGDFIGIPNNGKITFELQKSASADGYNLIGNPYPSNIDFHALVATGAIKGTAYFWTNVNPTPETQQGSAYDGLNYATYNLSGGVSSTNGPIAPERYIKVGQGFMVQAAEQATLTFTNAMRNDGTGLSKFMNKGTASNNDSIDRFWLKLITPAQNFNTILIAYPQGATNGFDSFADAKQFGESSDSFYTILNDYKLNIQGRQFPLVKSDVVPVGMKGFETGEYKIAMVLKEGIFANGQNVYLRDNQANTLTNLSTGDYTFAANAGLTEGRFEITYQNDNVLGTDNIKKDELVVYREGTDFIVKSAKKKISELEVYDTSGRLMIKLKPNETEVRIAGQTMVNGVYILKINQNGKITTRKTIR